MSSVTVPSLRIHYPLTNKLERCFGVTLSEMKSTIAPLTRIVSILYLLNPRPRARRRRIYRERQLHKDHDRVDAPRTPCLSAARRGPEQQLHVPAGPVDARTSRGREDEEAVTEASRSLTSSFQFSCNRSRHATSSVRPRLFVRSSTLLDRVEASLLRATALARERERLCLA